MPGDIEARRRVRVVGAHHIAALAFRLAGLFALVAVLWAIVVAIGGGSWWGPLHSFLAGTILLAISGATQLFTVTWSAAPAPTGALAAAQRWSLAVGVAMATVGMTTSTAWLVVLGATLVLAGVAILGVSLVSTVRSSLLRRFDLSARFYLLALAAGVVGIGLGGIMGSGFAGDSYARLRLVHSHLNLIGLVGLTIVGTLPTILPTFAHHRAVSGLEAKVAWSVGLAGVLAIAAGLLAEMWVGVGNLMVAVSLALVMGGVVLRLGRRGLGGGLPYLQVSAGALWLLTWLAVDGARLLTGAAALPYPAWTGAVVVAGLGQVLLGSLAYLLPVLAGPPPRVGRNRQLATSRGWLPLFLANSTGLAILAGPSAAALVLGIAWAGDFLVRLARMDWDRQATKAVS